MSDEQECELCGGKGEVIGCPLCIEREKDAEIERLRAENKLLLEHIRILGGQPPDAPKSE